MNSGDVIIESAVKVLRRTSCDHPRRAIRMQRADDMETQMLVGNPEYDALNLEMACWILEAAGETVTDLTNAAYMDAQLQAAEIEKNGWYERPITADEIALTAVEYNVQQARKRDIDVEYFEKRLEEERAKSTRP